ncbi:MAG: hypothetical protein SGJ27_08040 [Candidatus Melainabacteria bacterium]|nr:hypothetical protein [Candidatus Melainabacteria bacterium]
MAAVGNGSDNLLSGKGAESTFTAIGADCSAKCHSDAYPKVGDSSSMNSAKGDSPGMGFGDMAKGMEEAVDSVPDQIADSQEQMIGGKGGGPRLWAPQKDVVDIGKAEDPFAHKGMETLALGAGDGKAFGLNKPDAITEKARQIADGIVLDQKKYS